MRNRCTHHPYIAGYWGRCHRSTMPVFALPGVRLRADGRFAGEEPDTRPAIVRVGAVLRLLGACESQVMQMIVQMRQAAASEQLEAACAGGDAPEIDMLLLLDRDVDLVRTFTSSSPSPSHSQTSTSCALFCAAPADAQRAPASTLH